MLSPTAVNSSASFLPEASFYSKCEPADEELTALPQILQLYLTGPLSGRDG